ncbi:MAG: GNAT family N-acetyltransferase [Chloroflexota bacterium]
MTSPVAIRAVEDADLPIFYEHQSDPIANAMAVVPARDRVSFDAHWVKIRATDTGLARTIVVDGVVVGMILSWLDGEDRWVGYWIGREYWGRGYASRALALLVEEIRDRPILASIADSNIGSRRVLEKCGFVRVGELAEEDGVAGSIYRLD